MPTPQPIIKTSAITTLTDLGLGENEARLYEILLNTPDATIPALKQKSPWSRTMLYYILEQLEGYELVEKKEVPAKSGPGTKTVYNASPPEKLEEMFADQEKELHRQKQALGQVIGDLRSVYNLAHNKPGVKFFEGVAGIREVTFDSLKSLGTIYTVIDMEATQKFAGEMNKEYVRKRIELGIFKKQITPDTPFTRERYKSLPPAGRLLEVRLLPQNKNPFKTGLQIYNDSISYSTMTNQSQIGVIITDKNIADMHKSLFEYIWDSLPSLNNSQAATAKLVS